MFSNFMPIKSHRSAPVAKPARQFVMLRKFFCVYRPYKESISKEMNNDNDLNLHSMTKLSGWLRYCSALGDTVPLIS